MTEMLMVLAVFWAGYKKFGLHAMVFGSYRPRHGSHVRSTIRVRGEHKGSPLTSGRGSVEDMLKSCRKALMLPSAYYHILPPSRKGLANAA